MAEVAFDKIRIVRAPLFESGRSVECGPTSDGVTSWGSWEFAWQTGPAGISERRACALIGLSRTVLHYERRTCGRLEALRGRVVSLAAQR